MNVKNILETINMIEEQKLDIRTITMGISLLDCIDSDGEKAREKIYKKITTCAKDLVKVGQEIESEFGIPIVNKIWYTNRQQESFCNTYIYNSRGL